MTGAEQAYPPLAISSRTQARARSASRHELKHLLADALARRWPLAGPWRDRSKWRRQEHAG